LAQPYKISSPGATRSPEFLKPWVKWWEVYCFRYAVKGKDKSHPRTGHEGPEGEMYSSTLSWTSTLDEGWSTPRPGRFTPRKRPGTHCLRGWVGPRAGLDGCGKSRPRRDSISGPSSP
jgi:hypothetical protein